MNTKREDTLQHAIKRAKLEHARIWVYSQHRKRTTWHILAHPEPSYQLEFTISETGDVDFMRRALIGP